MTISFAKAQRRWREDPDYRKAHGALVHEYELAKELVWARLGAGLSQAQVAERMGTSQPAVARLEAGHKPSLRTLERYAEATGSRLVIRVRPLAEAEKGADERKARAPQTTVGL